MSFINQFERVCFQNVNIKDHLNSKGTAEFRGPTTFKGPVEVDAQSFTVKKDLVVEGDVEVCGDVEVKGIVTEDFVRGKCKDYERLRCMCPNEPKKLGTSTSCQAGGYKQYPQQAGGKWSTGLKIDYDGDANKYSIPALCPDLTFDLVPSSVEAGAMDSEIISAGFVGPFASRSSNWVWYGATCDDENFYYSVNGGPSLFASIFGFGTSNIFVCRRKSDASLVWVANSQKYSLLLPGSTNFVGSPNRTPRLTLTICGDRLYTTTMLSNIGPELFCINKATGAPIWTMAYSLPSGLGTGTLESPTTPINSFDASTYAGQQAKLGDLHVSACEITPGVVSLFVGIASFQNAINPSSLWPVFTDQGALVRIDDLGSTATRVWQAVTCPPTLNIGDTIVAGDPDPNLDPFRPGETEVVIWRHTTVGTFADAGGVIGKVLDNTGPHPGFRPITYTGPGGPNNMTMPAAYTRQVASSDLPLTEADFPSTFRTPAPGVGSGARIYQFYTTSPAGAKTITDVLTDMNTILPGLTTSGPVRVNIWAYLSGGEVTAIDGAGAPFLADNIGVRYVACLPDGYTIANAQEVEALGYWGNSVWAQAPIIDTKNSYVYFGTGQAHAAPLDEELFFQDPVYDYRKRLEPLMDKMYEYTQDDATLGGAGPFASLKDVCDEKVSVMATHTTQCSDTMAMSPRGRRAYSDAMMVVDLETGSIEFGYRTMPSDIASFTAEPFIIKEVPLIGTDADASSGVQYFDKVQFDGGKYGQALATVNKGGVICHLDISGLNRAVPFDHTDIASKGVIPSHVYAGAMSALGGSNYGSAQDGGQLMIYETHNFSVDVQVSGARSPTYQDNFNDGFEFHITDDGRALKIQDSVVGAYDVGTKKIAWETNMGQITFGYPGVYNGVVFVSSSTGLLLGLDVSTGEKIYALDGSQFGLGGISPPIFDQGCGIFIHNYPNGPGTNGNTGITMKIKKEKLLTPDTTIEGLLDGNTFTSFDVIPKLPGATVTDVPLIEPEAITHVWTGTSLAATHVPDGGGPEAVTADADCLLYGNNQTLLFKKGTVATGIRYSNIRFINCDIYLLQYQRLESGVWANKEALFKLVVV